MSTFNNKTIAITGAASGLGAALARAFLKQGANLALSDIDPSLNEAWLDHERVNTSRVDVTDAKAVSAWALNVRERFGGCDILINNAGITVLATFADHRLEDWENVLAVNLWGPVYCTQAFLPMLTERRGQLVNISSAFGIVALPGQAAYTASKYAIRGLSEVLWEELRSEGVSVTVVHPGGIATQIAKRGIVRNPLWNEHVRERIIPYFETKAMPADKAAAKILSAVQRRKPRLLIGTDALWFDALKRMLPVLGNYLVYRKIHSTFGISELEDEGGKLRPEARGEAKPPSDVSSD